MKTELMLIMCATILCRGSPSDLPYDVTTSLTTEGRGGGNRSPYDVTTTSSTTRARVYTLTSTATRLTTEARDGHRIVANSFLLLLLLLLIPVLLLMAGGLWFLIFKKRRKSNHDSQKANTAGETNTDVVVYENVPRAPAPDSTYQTLSADTRDHNVYSSLNTQPPSY